MSNDDQPTLLHYLLVCGVFLWILWSALNLVANLADEQTRPLPAQQEQKQ
jgi:hypothetical protein